MNKTEFNPGDWVQHTRFGRGSVLLDEGETVIVRFEHSLESCEKNRSVPSSHPAAGNLPQ